MTTQIKTRELEMGHSGDRRADKRNASGGRPNRRGWLRKGLVIVVLVNLFLALTYGRVMANSYFGTTITEGVRVDGVILSGLNKKEALEALQWNFKAQAEKKVVFRKGQKQYLYSYRDMGLQVNADKTVQKALDFGKQGSLQDRYRELSLARGGKVDLSLHFDIDENLIKAKIDELAEKLEIAPKNATFTVTEQGTLEIVTDEPGLEIDRTTALQTLKETDFSESVTITLNPVTVYPEITTSAIERLAPTKLLSETSTDFDPSNVTRKENLRVAAKMINNKFFAPGEVISFNKVVGPRVVERGFKEANVIINGKFVPGVGGGICQVSSTLYNSVLKANLKINRRSHHSLKVGYLPAGLDATISGNEIDFKFQNTTPGYILIKAKVSGSKITISIFGVPEAKEYEVRVISKVLSTIPNKFVNIPDNQLFVGQEDVVQKGQPGYKAKVTRELWKDGKLVKSEVISNDSYKAQDRIVHVGVRPWQ